MDSYPLLQYVDLSANEIVDIEDDALGRLEILITLRLADNKITTVPQSLPASLCHLYLQRNQITDIQPGWFGQLHNLEVLDLSGNRLTYLPALPLPRLIQLNVRESGLRGLSQSVVKTSPNLKDLLLERNPIKCTDLMGIAEWTTACRSENELDVAVEETVPETLSSIWWQHRIKGQRCKALAARKSRADAYRPQCVNEKMIKAQRTNNQIYGVASDATPTTATTTEMRNFYLAAAQGEGATVKINAHTIATLMSAPKQRVGNEDHSDDNGGNNFKSTKVGETKILSDEKSEASKRKWKNTTKTTRKYFANSNNSAVVAKIKPIVGAEAVSSNLHSKTNSTKHVINNNDNNASLKLGRSGGDDEKEIKLLSSTSFDERNSFNRNNGKDSGRNEFIISTAASLSLSSSTPTKKPLPPPPPIFLSSSASLSQQQKIDLDAINRIQMTNKIEQWQKELGQQKINPDDAVAEEFLKDEAAAESTKNDLRQPQQILIMNGMNVIKKPNDAIVKYHRPHSEIVVVRNNQNPTTLTTTTTSSSENDKFAHLVDSLTQMMTEQKADDDHTSATQTGLLSKNKSNSSSSIRRKVVDKTLPNKQSKSQQQRASVGGAEKINWNTNKPIVQQDNTNGSTTEIVKQQHDEFVQVHSENHANKYAKPPPSPSSMRSINFEFEYAKRTQQMANDANTATTTNTILNVLSTTMNTTNDKSYGQPSVGKTTPPPTTSLPIEMDKVYDIGKWTATRKTKEPHRTTIDSNNQNKTNNKSAPVATLTAEDGSEKSRKMKFHQKQHINAKSIQYSMNNFLLAEQSIGGGIYDDISNSPIINDNAKEFNEANENAISASATNQQYYDNTVDDWTEARNMKILNNKLEMMEPTTRVTASTTKGTDNAIIRNDDDDGNIDVASSPHQNEPQGDGNGRVQALEITTTKANIVKHHYSINHSIINASNPYPRHHHPPQDNNSINNTMENRTLNNGNGSTASTSGVPEQWNDVRTTTTGHPGLFIVIGVTISMIVSLGLIHLYRFRKPWRRRRQNNAGGEADDMDDDPYCHSSPTYPNHQQQHNSRHYHQHYHNQPHQHHQDMMPMELLGQSRIHYTDAPIELW